MSIVVTDHCTNSDGTAITAHTGDSGHTWAACTFNGGSGTIQSNALRLSTGARYTRCAYYSSYAASNDYETGIDFVAASNAPSNEMQVLAGVRVSTSAQTGYFGGCSGGDQIFMFKWVNGTYTLLSAGGYYLTQISGETYRFTMQASGTTISLYVQRASDGKWLSAANTFQTTKAAAVSVTDTSISSGRPAVSAVNNGSDGLAIAIDNITVDDLASAAPTLTSPTGTQTGSTTASGTVSTDTASGTLYYLASTNASESDATIKAAASQAVSSTGVQNVSFTGLSPSTTYYAHYLHTSSGGDSAAAHSTGFTTTAGGGSAAVVLLHLLRRLRG